MRGKWFARYSLGATALLWGGAFSQQESLTIFGNSPFQALEQTEADTLAARPGAIPPDSARRQLQFEIDAGYHQPPVHPYFRDEYRLLQDVRRLIQFVDRYAVHGMESLPELKTLVESMPVSKQTEIIRTAVAGSVVNYVSEMVSRQLRKKNVTGVQWQLETVWFRRQIGMLHLSGYGGINAMGLNAQLPKLRLFYSRHATNDYRYDSLSYWPWPQAGFNYMLLDNRTLLGPRFSFGPSHVAISYDKDWRLIVSGFALRRSNRIIIRMEYLNYLQIANADYLRSEVLWQW
jgi:hypothetical protein